MYKLHVNLLCLKYLEHNTEIADYIQIYLRGIDRLFPQTYQNSFKSHVLTLRGFIAQGIHCTH